jgi:hypothetical protein
MEIKKHRMDGHESLLKAHTPVPQTKIKLDNELGEESLTKSYSPATDINKSLIGPESILNSQDLSYFFGGEWESEEEILNEALLYENLDISKENPNFLLTSGSILTSNKAMAQNQKIKIMGRAKGDYGSRKQLLKRIKIVKFVALFIYFMIQIFAVPRWCKADKSIEDQTWCDNHKYPNSQIPKVSIYVSFVIETIALVTLGK